VWFKKISIPHKCRELEILEGRRVREGTKLQSLYGRKMEVRRIHLQIPSLVGYAYFLELYNL